MCSTSIQLCVLYILFKSVNNISCLTNSLTTSSLNPQSTTSSHIEFYYMEDTNYVEGEKCREFDCIQLNKTAKTSDRVSALTANIMQEAILTPAGVQNISSYIDKDNVLVVARNLCNLYNSSLENNISDKVDSDRIKFFELYDQLTEKSFINETLTKNVSKENANEVTDKVEKVSLEHVDQSSHDHNNYSRHSKKHILMHNAENLNNENKKQQVAEKAFTLTHMPFEKYNVISDNVNTNLNQRTFDPNNGNSELGRRNVSWSEYPFAAVYIYEPSLVHCDAAGISPHWLVASGSCLSRVTKNPVGAGQSAFVAYCGEQWWLPERVAYVKYSFVHPYYNSRDRTRRNLYNIGVIKVVTSMRSACAAYTPVPMISHQTNRGSMEATAVGWGLDRFDARYGPTELPKRPLRAYKGIVHYGSCPGNMDYNKTLSNEASGVKNVHCLSLPPYAGEESDSMHGGLLLAGGKLIALYLQEERRPWGPQSAQYTGIWQLIPWVIDVAREREDIDSISFELYN